MDIHIYQSVSICSFSRRACWFYGFREKVETLCMTIGRVIMRDVMHSPVTILFCFVLFV